MRKLLLLLAIGSITAIATSQTGYYLVPGSDAGNPGSLNADAEYPSGSGLPTGWTVRSSGSASAAWTSNITLPFAFKFNGTDVTEYKISTTGVVTFDVSASAVPSISNEDLPSANLPDNSIVCWGINVPTGDYIVTKTFGTAPNRQHWIHFNSAHEANLTDGWIYMSIVLEESTNNIYIVDQRTQCIKNSANCTEKTKLSVGIQVNSTTAFKLPGTPAFASVNLNNFEVADNRYFSFRPGPQPAEDAAAVAVDLPEFLLTPSAPFTIKAKIKNNGTATITSVNFSYFATGADTFTGSATGLSIAAGATASINHPVTWNPSIGTYKLNIFLNTVNDSTDGYLADNKTSKSLTVADKIIPRKVLHEVFTSSSCGPCAPGNANYESIVGSKTQHTTIKYQMYYPGNGDPYYFTENGTRHSFYGINSIPRMEVDGGWNSNANAYTEALYDGFASKPSFMAITGTAEYSWKNTINANITITPAANYTSTNLKVFAVIIEKNTYNNVATNGETEFQNVVKKVMPTASGSTLTGGLTKDLEVTRTFSFAFKGAYRLPANGQSANIINLSTEHSVENFDNLAVVVFVQDASTKEVFQSEVFDVATTAVSNVENGEIQISPVPAQDVVYVEAGGAMQSMSAKVTITNSLGQAVQTGQMENGVCILNTKDLVDGVYFVQIAGATEMITRKIVIQH